MSIKSLTAIIFLVIAAIIISGSVYTVDEREKAIVLKFGEIISTDVKPGLHFKMPYVNNVRFFDARVQTLDADPAQYFTVNKKNLVVDSFVKWRIRDVREFYTRLQGRKDNAGTRLAQRVNDSLRQEFGKRTLQQVISGDRSQIMDVVRRVMDKEAASIGIEVIDVRLKRVDLVREVSRTVYERMSSERKQIANNFRATGAEEAEKIRADADRQSKIIVATAQKQAEQIRGNGDATSITIYADAFGQDKEFYRFYRSLNAYKKTFTDKSDLFVIDPSSEFFRYFKQIDASN